MLITPQFINDLYFKHKYTFQGKHILAGKGV